MRTWPSPSKLRFFFPPEERERAHAPVSSLLTYVPSHGTLFFLSCYEGTSGARSRFSSLACLFLIRLHFFRPWFARWKTFGRADPPPPPPFLRSDESFPLPLILRLFVPSQQGDPWGGGGFWVVCPHQLFRMKTGSDHLSF